MLPQRNFVLWERSRCSAWCVFVQSAGAHCFPSVFLTFGSAPVASLSAFLCKMRTRIASPACFCALGALPLLRLARFCTKCGRALLPQRVFDLCERSHCSAWCVFVQSAGASGLVASLRRLSAAAMPLTSRTFRRLTLSRRSRCAGLSLRSGAFSLTDA